MPQWKFDGIIFDLDGTLWNAVPEIAQAWNSCLPEDIPPLTAAQMRPCMGLPMDEMSRRLFPGIPDARRLQILQDCMDEENRYLARHAGELYPSVTRTLEELEQQSALFVVSNCQDGYIQAFFTGTGMGRYFQDFECEGRTGKPKAQNIQLICRRNQLVRPIYIGDTELDCRSAQEAGVPFLHAAYGFGALKKQTAPSVNAFREIPAALEILSAIR